MTGLSERMPPQSMEAEKAVLGACLLNGDAIYSALEHVRPADFYRQEHQTIFSCMLDLNESHIPCDIVTVMEALQKKGLLEQAGGVAYLAELTNEVPSAASAAHYGKIVADKALQRALIQAAQQLVENGYSGSRDGLELLGDAESIIHEVGDRNSRQGFQIADQVMMAEFQRIDDLKSSDGVTGIPTFRDLDKYLSGLQKGDLVLLAARPAVGKTSFAMNIAANASVRHDCSVAVFSLEMPSAQLAQRMLCTYAKVDQSKWRSGRISGDDIAKLSDSLTGFVGKNLYLDDNPGTSVAEMRAKCRRLKGDKGLDLIVVDYLQLMHSTRKVESRQQEIAEISRSLKGLAKELDVPVLALSQLSRQAEQGGEKAPLLSHLRESGSLEQDADVVLFLNRPKGEEGEEDAPSGIIEVIVAKNRNGPVGTEKLGFQKTYTQFMDLTEQFPPI